MYNGGTESDVVQKRRKCVNCTRKAICGGLEKVLPIIAVLRQYPKDWRRKLIGMFYPNLQPFAS